MVAIVAQIYNSATAPYTIITTLHAPPNSTLLEKPSEARTLAAPVGFPPCPEFGDMVPVVLEP